MQNGGVARDGKSVTWKLKRGVQWHDGKPFTADDVVFNWEYAADPATAATTLGTFKDIDRIDKVDSHTVKIVFKQADAVLGRRRSAASRGPDHSQAPVRGLQGRQVARGADQPQAGRHRALQVRGLQARRHHPGRAQPRLPHGQPAVLRHPRDEGRRRRRLRGPRRHPDRRVRLRAGTCRSRTRSSSAWSRAARARSTSREAGNIEHIQCNFTDPWKEVDGERSSLKTTHPFLTDPAVRQALSLLVDRASIQEQIYGRLGRSQRELPERAVALPLEEHQVGVQRRQGQPDPGGGGLEARRPTASGPRTARSSRWSSRRRSTQPRQKTQAIVKQAAAKAGIDMEIKSVVASVFFSSDVANPDTYTNFYTDIQMYTTTMGAPDPAGVHEPVHRRGRSPPRTTSGRAATSPRWRNEEYDQLCKAARGRARPGQARGPLHQDERPRHPERRRHPRAVAHRHLRRRPQAQEHGHLGLGLELLEPRATGTARPERRPDGGRARGPGPRASCPSTSSGS